MGLEYSLILLNKNLFKCVFLNSEMCAMLSRVFQLINDALFPTDGGRIETRGHFDDK